MRHQPRHQQLALVLATVVLAACGRGDAAEPLADDLQRDLDLLSGTAVELAPRAGGQQVVSAIERIPPSPQARPTATVARRSPVPTPPEPVVAPVTVSATPEPDVAAPVPVATRDTLAPAGAARPAPPTVPQRKAPPGGWKTPSEVIRNAPFPINP